MKSQAVIAGILAVVITATLRFVGIDWDSGTHLHPDERFLTMVATNIRWPQSPQEYFDTHASPLNPHNMGHKFYVYGTWPIAITKAVAQTLRRDSYDGFPLVARSASAFVDILTAGLVFAITLILTKRYDTSVLALFLYGISVLPIQLSHFFSVDTFANLFTTATLLLIVRLLSLKKLLLNKLLATVMLMGACTGLAVGAKISSAIILPIVFIFLLIWVIKLPKNNIGTGFCVFITISISFACVIRLTYPYLFDGWQLNPLVLANWKELKAFDGAETHFPPALQWIGTVPVLYPLIDLMTWGLGLPLGIICVFAVILSVWRTRRVDGTTILLCVIGVIFGYQSIQFAKPLRYMIPIYPALAVIAALLLSRIFHFLSTRFRFGQLINWSICFLLLLWPIAFTSIYRRPHTRVSASQWIYAHVPSASTIAWETWDDPLPLRLSGRQISEYKTIPLSIYDPDSAEKWKKISRELSETDYLILSSNRVYGGTARAKKRYTVTNRYYELLFSNQLGFEKVAEFISRPSLPFFTPTCIRPLDATYGSINPATCEKLGIHIVDDYAEESFTVYDHPKVTILNNRQRFSADRLYSLITLE